MPPQPSPLPEPGQASADVTPRDSRADCTVRSLAPAPAGTPVALRRRASQLLPLGVALLTGCTGPRMAPAPVSGRPAADHPEAFARAVHGLKGRFPPTYRATHRAVIEFGRRHYVCDGFLSASPEEGLHLAVVSALGLVTEVRVRGAAEPEILKTTALFRASWARDLLGRDLRWLFGTPGELRWAGVRHDGRLQLETPPGADGLKGRYVCSRDGARWEELELQRRGRRVAHATVARWHQFPDWPTAVPAEITLEAEDYRLSLRVVELTIPGRDGAARTRERTGRGSSPSALVAAALRRRPGVARPFPGRRAEGSSASGESPVSGSPNPPGAGGSG